VHCRVSEPALVELLLVERGVFDPSLDSGLTERFDAIEDEVGVVFERVLASQDQRLKNHRRKGHGVGGGYSSPTTPHTASAGCTVWNG